MRMNVLVDASEVQQAIDRMRSKVPQYGSALVSEISAGSRKVAYGRFFNRTYSTNNPNSLNIANRYGIRMYKDKNGRRTIRRGPAFTMMTKAGRVDRKGRRMVKFALNVRHPFTKVATFSAYPLNLYENDVINHGKKRPGTHIMMTKIPPAVQGTIIQSIQEIDSRIEQDFDLSGGKR